MVVVQKVSTGTNGIPVKTWWNEKLVCISKSEKNIFKKCLYAEQIRLLFNSMQYFWCCVTLLFVSSLIKVVLFLGGKGDV